MKKAIILAAGRGSRLNKYTGNLPKCMLQFKGMTLIERQVRVLRECGIDDIVIVKGYKANKIKIDGVSNYINREYAHTNMVSTLFCAEKEMNQDLLVIYADIIYQPEVIKKAMEAKSDIAVTVDTDYWDYWKARLDNPEDDIESLVIDASGKIVDLGNTHCSEDEAKVRYVGIIRFSKKGLIALKKVYYKNKEKYYERDEPWLRSKSFKKAYMTCILQALINSRYRVNPIYVRHGWLEFDTNEDYEKAINWDEKRTLSRFIKL